MLIVVVFCGCHHGRSFVVLSFVDSLSSPSLPFDCYAGFIGSLLMSFLMISSSFLTSSRVVFLRNTFFNRIISEQGK